MKKKKGEANEITSESLEIKKEDKKSEKEKSSKEGRSKSKKKGKKKEEVKEMDVVIEKKYLNFNLDFIYRRERYTLKNILSNYLVSGVKKLISKKIEVESELLKIYYMEKELTDDKANVYDMIKDNKVKYFEVKKESPINENILSINTNVHLIYKVKCFGIPDAMDFMDKIDGFFKDKCLEKHYLCEPTGNDSYEVGFACEDLTFQFKRYMMLIKRLDSSYANSTYDFVPVDKSKVIHPKLNILKNSAEPEEGIYFNKGPYITYDEIKKSEEKEEKKKWINKNGFVYKKKK